MKIAFFDFDGTITARDSFIDFLIYATGYLNFIAGLCILSPALLAFKCNFIPNWRAKEIVLSHFFKSWELEEFRTLASKYARERLPRIIRTTAMQRIAWHKSQGDRVVVVTAAIDCWIMDWCGRNGLDLLATQLEVAEGRLTGRLGTKNCYGPEKVRRIKAAYNLEEFSRIYAYGDSPGDREMLALADCAHLVSGKGISPVLP
ncbi:MAG: HAD-IB family hydrolase [Desulfobaccales bacterium]